MTAHVADFSRSPTVSLFHPVDLLQGAGTGATAFATEAGWSFFAQKAGIVVTGARLWYPQAGDSITVRLWRNGVQVASVALTTANGVNAVSFSSPITLDPNIKYVVSYSGGGRYFQSTGSSDAISAYVSAFTGSNGSADKVIVAGDIFYALPVTSGGVAGSYPSASLIAGGGGIVGIEPVLR